MKTHTPASALSSIPSSAKQASAVATTLHLSPRSPPLALPLPHPLSPLGSPNAVARSLLFSSPSPSPHSLPPLLRALTLPFSPSLYLPPFPSLPFFLQFSRLRHVLPSIVFAGVCFRVSGRPLRIFNVIFSLFHMRFLVIFVVAVTCFGMFFLSPSYHNHLLIQE